MAWVREKKPKRKQAVIEDPVDRFNGALHFFAGRVPQVDRGRIMDHQRQLVKYGTPSNPIQHMMHARKAAVVAQQRADHRPTVQRPVGHRPAVHQGSKAPRPNHHAEDYAIVNYDEEEDDDREQYEVRVYEKPRQHVGLQYTKYHYEGDMSPEPPRPRAKPPSPNLRSQPSRRHRSSGGGRARESRWASATASLASLS